MRAARAQARFIEPMQCRTIDRLPEGYAWPYEVNFDGCRAQAVKSGERVQLLSRHQRDFGPLFPALAQAFEGLPQETIIDGEIVALNLQGRPSFNLLQNYQAAAQSIVYYAFDLLMLSGRSLIDRPLEERRKCSKVA